MIRSVWAFTRETHRNNHENSLKKTIKQTENKNVLFLHRSRFIIFQNEGMDREMWNGVAMVRSTDSHTTLFFATSSGFWFLLLCEMRALNPILNGFWAACIQAIRVDFETSIIHECLIVQFVAEILVVFFFCEAGGPPLSNYVYVIHAKR